MGGGWGQLWDLSLNLLEVYCLQDYMLYTYYQRIKDRLHIKMYVLVTPMLKGNFNVWRFLWVKKNIPARQAKTFNFRVQF